MMQITNRIGFHFGSQSNATGWGEYVRELDAAGIPAVVMSVGGEGVGDIVACWDNGSTVDHRVVVRCLSHNDVPLYDYPIDFAVDEWLDRYIPFIGTEIDKYHDRIVTKHGNELNKEKIQWLADFYTSLHPALLERMGWENHRICVFNFSGGEPEYSDWESIAPFLKLAAENPDKFMIGVHEYSFNENDILNGYPYYVGRVWSHLFDVCENYNTGYPFVAIHEFGWRDKVIPATVEQAINDIDEAMRMYAEEIGDRLFGAGIWTLQAWQNSGINDKVQKLIKPVKELTLRTLYDAKEFNMTNLQKVIVLLTPQYSQMTDDQKNKVRLYQEKGFPIESGVTYGEHTSTPAYTDALELFLGGNNDSILGIPFPHISGFTPEWMLNYSVGDRKVVYLDYEIEQPNELEKGDIVVDISYYQGATVNFNTLIENGVKRFIIRATSGKRYASTDSEGVDRYFEININRAIASNIPVEVYMFLNNEESYAEQIDRFYNTVRDAQGRGAEIVGVAIDCEGEYSPQTESELREAITLFVNKNSVCENTVVYSGGWWWNKIVSAKSTWPLELGLQQWCAYYYGATGEPIKILPPVDSYYTKLNGFNGKNIRYWQFTSNGGQVVGHSTYRLDLNYYIGGDVTPPPPPVGDEINLLDFMIADPFCWRVVKHVSPSGHETNEDVQDYVYDTGKLVRRKNTNSEWWSYDSNYFYLDHDTSPDATRVYTLYKDGKVGAPKNKIKQRVGEQWMETGQHLVKFRSKNGCAILSEYNNQNSAKIIRHEKDYVFNSYGQNLKFDEVIWIDTGGSEIQIYGRINGTSAGWIGWQADWGFSEPVEIYFNRGALSALPNKFCGF